MNLVIPYTDDKRDGDELRYAIRSMVKHFKSLHQVIIVGDCPTWFTGIHIACSDIPKQRELSVLNKLKKVQGIILYSHDDVYALQDFDETLPKYYNSRVQNITRKIIDRTYKNLYRKCDPAWFNYELHCPMIIDTTKLTWEDDRLLKTTYANIYNLPGTEANDCKIRHNPLFSEVRERIKGYMFWSSHDNGHQPGINKMLETLYPNRSNFEK